MARYLDCIKNYRNALVDQIKTADIDGIGDAVFLSASRNRSRKNAVMWSWIMTGRTFLF